MRKLKQLFFLGGPLLLALIFLVSCESIFGLNDEATDGVVVIVNESAVPITAVYIDLVTSDSRREVNRLEHGETIEPGTKKKFKVDEGVYTVYAEAEDRFWESEEPVDLKKFDYKLSCRD